MQAHSYSQLQACRRRSAQDTRGGFQWVLRLRSQELDTRATKITAHLNGSRERKL